MELDEGQLRSVPDGGPLHVLPNGIQIIRRKKHEPIDLEGLDRDELARRTGKLEGSKFLPGTSLGRIVEMTCEILLENGAQVGSNEAYNRVHRDTIGISRGRRVRGLRVRRSGNGKVAHAYPEDERVL